MVRHTCSPDFSPQMGMGNFDPAAWSMDPEVEVEPEPEPEPEPDRSGDAEFEFQPWSNCIVSVTRPPV